MNFIKQIEDDLLSTQVQLQKAQSIAVDAESRAEAASKQVPRGGGGCRSPYTIIVSLNL